MNRKSILVAIEIFVFSLLTSSSIFADSNHGLKSSPSSSAIESFPFAIEAIAQPFYRHRADGNPGREILVKFKGKKFVGSGNIELQYSDKMEVFPIISMDSIDHYSVLLSDGAGVKSDCLTKIVLRSANKELSTSLIVPAKRQWTVYIYPHSHVDIGYTNTHSNVELIHKRNLLNGIDLAKKTANYPEGSRYLWNPEVLWPVERYLKNASESQRQNIIEAVKKGYLRLDAGYIHANTSSFSDEELFEFFRYRNELQELTGTKIETLVQVDIPGMSWGIPPVAAKLGVKYCFVLNNGSDRVGHSMEQSFKPFWWLGPDGKSKVLFFQPGSYAVGAQLKGFNFWPLMAGQTDSAKLIPLVKTEHPRENFIDKYLAEKLPELENSDYYPYDIFAMSWAMADNTPIDADLPEAVKSWNEDYAFPHLVIAGATDIMRVFEDKYGEQLPVLSGDFTEYWTDGLGTAAKQTAMNRASKERLIQTETLWSMLHPGEPAPRQAIEEAWRNVIMGTEHTWCYMDPSKQPITNDILKVKFGYFDDAATQSKELLNRALSTVSDETSSVIGVFNTLSWVRGGLVYVPEMQSKLYNSVYDEKGQAVLSQRLTSGQLVFIASDIPSFGLRKYFLSRSKSNFKGSFALENILDNGIVRLKIDPQSGDISSLTLNNQEFVDSTANSRLNSYRYLLGKVKSKTSGPQYATIAQSHENNTVEQVKASEATDVRLSIRENGPLVSSILIESKAEGCKWLKREITLIAGQSHLEISNTIEKITVLEKEGIHFGFGFNVPNPITRVDVPWGIMELEKDQLKAGNRNWITFQRWLDVSNNNKGVTFCSLDAPVFESGNLTANIIGSATNSPEWIRELRPSSTIYSWALNNHWHTNFPLSQEGVIQFRYSLMPHASNYDAVVSNRFGMEQVQTLVACPVKSEIKLKPPVKIVASSTITLSSLITSSDGKSSLIRLRSVSTKDEPVKLIWPGSHPKTIQLIDEGTDPHLAKIQNEVIVPSMGLVTLYIIW